MVRALEIIVTTFNSQWTCSIMFFWSSKFHIHFALWKEWNIYIFTFRYHSFLFHYISFFMLLCVNGLVKHGTCRLLLINLRLHHIVLDLVFENFYPLILSELLHRVDIGHVGQPLIAPLAQHWLMQEVSTVLLSTLAEDLNWGSVFCLFLLL